MRISEPNPRTGLPSHLGPTLDRIDRLLEPARGALPQLAMRNQQELGEIDRRMHHARGNEEVLALLERWDVLMKELKREESSSAEQGVDGPRARNGRSSTLFSQSFPSLPVSVPHDSGAGRLWSPARRTPALFSPVGSRRLCAFDEDEAPAALGRLDLDPQQRIELRSLSKACAILLDALLATLLVLTERVIAARQFWSYYTVRSAQYVIWSGPRRWLGVHPMELGETYFRASHEPSERVRALSELIALMASHIGRVHLSLVEFLRCNSRKQLQDAVRAGVDTLHGLLSPGMKFGREPSLLDRADSSARKKSQSATDTPMLGKEWREPPLDDVRWRMTAAAQRWPIYESRLREELRGLDTPSHWGRNWLRYAVVGGVSIGAGTWLRRFGVEDITWLVRGLGDSLKQWWTEHLKQPLTYMYNEIVHRRYLVVSDPQQLDDARRSLEAMVGSFCERNKSTISEAAAAGLASMVAATGLTSASADAAAAARSAGVGGKVSKAADSGSSSLKTMPTRSSAHGPSAPPHTSREVVDKQLEMISRLFEKQAGSAVYNLVSGDLVEIMLIQMTLLKKEVFEMMAALDQLMRENYFTASMMAAVPGTLAVGSVVYLFWKLVRKMRARWSRKHSRRSVQKMLRQSLRDIERLLLRYHQPTPASEAGAPADEGGRGRTPDLLTLQDRGVLVLELHNLLQCVRHHLHLFEHADMQNLVEDLRDLEGDALTACQKLYTVGRIYRTQTILGMSHRMIWGPLSDQS